MKRNIITFTCIMLVNMAFSQAVNNENVGRGHDPARRDFSLAKNNDARLAPRLLNYQGYLTDTLGNPINNSSVSMSFAIFDNSSGGAQKWTETQPSVSVDKGIFNVLLGSVTAIPDSVFLNSTGRWLELSVAGQTLTPRTQIVSSAYAYTSTYSDTAVYARNSAPDNDWIYLISDGADTTLQMGGRWGVARPGNMLYGTADSTHVNLGVISTTGTLGQNNKYCTVGGGNNNAASLPGATVAGGASNTASNTYATVGGGLMDTVKAIFGGVSSGWHNVAGDQIGDTAAFVGGGRDNLAIASYATVSGGTSNKATAKYATVSGGYFNTAGWLYATVAGGDHNTASGLHAAIGGGSDNTASGDHATVGGGSSNAASEYQSTVGGGEANGASEYFSTVGGGYSNSAEGIYTTIAGGYADTISETGQYSYLFGINSNLTEDSTFMVDLPHIRFGTETNGYEFPISRGTNGQLLATDSSGQLAWSFGGSEWIFRVSEGADTTLQMGGKWGLARAGNMLYGIYDRTHINFGVACTTGTDGEHFEYCTVSGGHLNAATGTGAAVGGGEHNSAGEYSTIGGGKSNIANGTYSTIAGGFDNDAGENSSTIYSTIGGGHVNSANDSGSTIGGGEANLAGKYGTVAGGKSNSTIQSYGSVGGGYYNNAEGPYASIGGGYENYAAHYFTAIGGGRENTAYDSNATVGGGFLNYAGGKYSAIVGGYADTISTTGDYSYLFGINSNLTQDSTIMVDMPHVWFGDEATGYEFPRQRGADGQVLYTNANGQLNWTYGVPDADWVITGSDMYSNVSGNVGIGTTSPRGKLDVDGSSDIWLVDDGLQSGSQNIHIPGSVIITPYATGNVAYFQARRSDNSGSTELRFRTFNSGSVTEAMHLSSTGHVGIGTTTPDTTLHIIGNIKMADGNQGAGKVLTSDASGLGTWQNTAMDNDWNFRVTDGNDTTLTTSSTWGLARAGNMLYGNADSTHVNLGVACATGFSGQNYKYCTVAGGYNNKASNQDATVGGGCNNTASGAMASVGGGFNNTASSQFTTVAGGWNNVANGSFATVGGGVQNYNVGNYSVIVGGYADTITTTGFCSYLFGVNSNLTQDSTFMVDMPHVWFGTEAMGYEFPRQRGTDGQAMVTNASGQLAWGSGSSDNDWNFLITDTADTTLQMGSRWGLARPGNTLYGNADSTHVNFGVACTTGSSGQNFKYCTVSGGYLNNASGTRATVGGGYSNTASGTHATVGGGISNNASNYAATVGGGRENSASNYYATVTGGRENSASNYYATVAGGYRDTAAAYFSFAANYSTMVAASDTNSAAFTTSHTIAKNQVRAAAFSTGTLDFAMDHPHDPMNKILNQYAVGSDEVMLMYCGSVVLNANGRATVDLPDYFDDINRNPRIQLTGVGTYEIYIAEDITGNRFTIGGRPNTKVYWTVTAERKDIHAEIARIQTPVVQEKKGGLRGHSIDDDAMIGIYDGLNQKNPDLFKFKTEEGRGVHEQAKRIVDGDQ
ncbi:MAG TPA: hypothetical protein VF399_06095 [bacterium]